MIESDDACEMTLDGTDTDGSEWFRCATHNALVCGDAYVCEGYTPPPYVKLEAERKLAETLARWRATPTG